MTRICVLCWLLLAVCCWGMPTAPTRRPVALARPYRRSWGAVLALGGIVVGVRLQVAVARH